jgi:transcriptional regulator with XRE-family HTH domain
MKRTGSNAMSVKVGQRMRLLRQARGWSAEQLARNLTASGYEISRVSVSSLECGIRSHVTVDEAVAIAAVFGMTVAALLDEGPACTTCLDAPPSGMVCLNCGTGGAR